MQYEEMLSWVLFYTSLLDVQKVPAQEVADPGGLVRMKDVGKRTKAALAQVKELDVPLVEHPHANLAGFELSFAQVHCGSQ